MTTLVLVPGLLSDDIVWQPVADAVAGKMPVHQADLTKGTSISGMAADLLAKVPGDLIVVGHSMGGRIAMEMAHQAPERLKGLVLANTGHVPRKDGEEVKRQAMIDLGHESMEKLADQWLPPMLDERRLSDTDLMDRLRAMVLRANADIHEGHISALVDRPNASAYLKDITCPTLLITGRQDVWSPIAQHEEIKAAMPDAELVVIEDAGHFAPVERPEPVVKAITDWLEDNLSEDTNSIPETPLFDRERSLKGYKLNKMANALGDPANREAFKADEDTFLDRFGLSAEEKTAVKTRDWHEMVRLGGNLFFILKISAVDPVPITQIGALQAGMSHEQFLTERLGKKVNNG